MKRISREHKGIVLLGILSIVIALLCSFSQQSQEQAKSFLSEQSKRPVATLEEVVKTTVGLSKMIQPKQSSIPWVKMIVILLLFSAITTFALLRRLFLYFILYRRKHIERNLIIIRYIARSDGMK